MGWDETTEEEDRERKRAERLRTAYRKWQAYGYYYDADSVCCDRAHTKEASSTAYRVSIETKWKADHQVCGRERAWREYVRIRDNNPEFPYRVTSYLGLKSVQKSLRMKALERELSNRLGIRLGPTTEDELLPDEDLEERGEYD